MVPLDRNISLVRMLVQALVLVRAGRMLVQILIPLIRDQMEAPKPAPESQTMTRMPTIVVTTTMLAVLIMVAARTAAAQIVEAARMAGAAVIVAAPVVEEAGISKSVYIRKLFTGRSLAPACFFVNR
jgi:hypothetical protein